MGNVLNSLNSKSAQQIFIDFENAQPTDKEKEVYDMVQEILDQGTDVMRQIEDYKGCADLARKAMQTPSHENEQEAFEGLLQAVDSIAAFFKYSKELERVLPPLLKAIGNHSAAEEEKSSLESQQALCKQLAHIFDFTLRFDQVRMLRPNLSNDFSYYRRLLPKFNKHPDIRIKDDEASGMALFTAEHIPMMNCCARAAAKSVEENSNTTEVLSVMAVSCLKMLKSKKFSKDETVLFCARAMTGAVVLYDHVDPVGVFSKKSPIPIKQVVLLLKKDLPQEVSLQNAIQFSTKTFRDAPQNIQDLFE